jgi:L-serine dehydratase
MRITYDFTPAKLPADKLATNRAEGQPVWLLVPLARDTARSASLAVNRQEPATVDPAFLDGLVTKPDQVFPVKLGDKTLR